MYVHIFVCYAKQDEVMLQLVLHPHNMVWGVCRGSLWRNGTEAELCVK